MLVAQRPGLVPVLGDGGVAGSSMFLARGGTTILALSAAELLVFELFLFELFFVEFLTATRW
jgi:hypothetical protein